jgi:hypothetical protein
MKLQWLTNLGEFLFWSIGDKTGGERQGHRGTEYSASGALTPRKIIPIAICDKEFIA